MVSGILLNVGYCGIMQNPGTWQHLAPWHFRFLSRSGGKARTGLPGLHLQTPRLNSSASAWPGRQTCGCWLWPPGYRAARAGRGTAPAAAGLPTSSFCCEAQVVSVPLLYQCPTIPPHKKSKPAPPWASYRLPNSEMLLASTHF